jgi:stage II sporulation protein D
LLTSSEAQLPRQTVRVAVLTLFHPQTLTVTLEHPTPAQLNGHPQTITTVTLTSEQSLTLPEATVTLTVPGKLTRTYRGAITVTPHDGALLPVLTIDSELAVASIVAAESPPNAPFEALKAQAIASRSFLLATPPGPLYDATDTTHDQFLRSPPPPNSPAARATAATAHIVLTWRPGTTPLIVRAMYARSCGGHTRPHPSSNPADYPFYAVTCSYCLRHPERWTRTAPSTPTEQARIAWNRAHGWSAIPSNTHTQSGALIQGQGTGHGVGLCQLGAADLAAHGQTATQILAHYYPNTTLTRLP